VLGALGPDQGSTPVEPVSAPLTLCVGFTYTARRGKPAAGRSRDPGLSVTRPLTIPAVLGVPSRRGATSDATDGRPPVCRRYGRV